MAFYHNAPALPSRLLCGLLVSTSVLLSMLLRSSPAQITLDGSLGPRETLNGPHYTISDRMGQSRGSNLFHSFGYFNLSQGESATFTWPTTITNILARITGGQPLTIDGTIRSEIPRAHLYLLNPSGIMFGPNASLDVSGSFHASTADYLRLADGARFVARLGETSTLSVAPPVAFGFSGPPAALAISGSALEVPAGQRLSLGGGYTDRQRQADSAEWTYQHRQSGGRRGVLARSRGAAGDRGRALVRASGHARAFR